MLLSGGGDRRESERAGLASSARTRALIAAGPLLMFQAEYARSGLVLKEALALAERRRDPAAIAEAATYLGHATVVAGDGEEGRRLQEARRGLTLPFAKGGCPGSDAARRNGPVSGRPRGGAAAWPDLIA